jgi:hypothetical protein
MKAVGVICHEPGNGLLADAVRRREVNEAEALAGSDFKAGELADELHGELGPGRVEDENGESAKRLQCALGDLLVRIGDAEVNARLRDSVLAEVLRQFRDGLRYFVGLVWRVSVSD